MTGARLSALTCVTWGIHSSLILVLLGLAVSGVLPANAAARDQVESARWNADAVIDQETFAKPPPEVADAVLAPRHLNVALGNLSPDKRWFLDEVDDGPVPMDVLAKPFHGLGGLFIDYAANRVRTLTIRNNVGIQIISAADGRTMAIDVPRGARVSGARWSPDGNRIAYLAHFPDATHIFVADIATGRSRRVTRTPLLATLVTGFEWVGDGSVAAVLIPDDRGPMPAEPQSPRGPRMKVAEESDENRLRTYRSLLATPQDKALLEWHTTGQLTLIDVQSGAGTEVGRPAMVQSFDFSPRGGYVLVTRMVEPFSYIVPVEKFGSVEELWDASGEVLVKLDEDSIELGVYGGDTSRAAGADSGSAGPSPPIRRELAWRPDGEGLTFLAQEPVSLSEPGGDRIALDTAAGTGSAAEGRDNDARAAGAGERKDRVMQWLPPFDRSSLRVVYEHDMRMSNHLFSRDMEILFVSERDGSTTRELAIYLDDPSKTYTLARYRTGNMYAHPGSLVTTRGGADGGRGRDGRPGAGETVDEGRTVQFCSDGEHVFFLGRQHDPKPREVGPKTFIDRVAIRTGEKERIFESNNDGVFESVAAILDADATRLVISRESPTAVPQYYLHENGRSAQLTHNKDYTPDVTRAPKRSFTVQRADGFEFRVDVRLPPDYRSGERLPAMFWFYPREYTGQEAYDRGSRTFNKNSFPDFDARSMAFLIRLGYAVVEPDIPIVGDAGRINDNYEHELRNTLAAVIDELDRRGIVDRERLAIGGHSYGAFSTVNAMVHTPFFKAGIAGDGAYNRTLTPLGFQRELRDFWEARDVYLSMSPFVYANNLIGALLLYHGLHDQNVGTDPINTPRLFHALNGLGKTVAMYLYPYEDHRPASKETLLDLWARWTAWLDKYVKNPRTPGVRITAEPDSTAGSASGSR